MPEAVSVHLSPSGPVVPSGPVSATAAIAPADRIPLLQKIMFSAGGTMDYVATGLSTSVLWMPYFNIGLGLNPALLGIILMVLRGWDAFMDPVFGNLSDNARSRWGRRRPFMFVGAILTAAVFPFLWQLPPGAGTTAQIVYLIVVGMIFFSCFSCWSMPYYGLQLELTPSYDERTRLTAWMTFCGKFTGLLGGWILAVLTCSWFANPVTGQPDIVHAVRICSWFIAGLILVTGLLPPLFVKERYYAAETRSQKKEPLWQSIRESAQCGPLWLLIGISFFLVVGSGFSGALGQYINIYLINQGRLAHASIIAGWISTATFVTGILTIPFWTWMGEKFDKKSLVVVLLTGSMLGHLLNLVCLRADEPYLQLFPAVFLSMAISAVWLFLPSMKADVADYDELNTTRRREGALNAFYSWFIKAGGTCAAGVGGIAVHLTGFSASVAVQPPGVLRRMKIIYLVLPLAIWSLTLIFIRFYPLNRQRMAVIRAELELRRGKV